MEFLDFQLRAWKASENEVQVLVHSSPVGSMRRPVTVPFSADEVAAVSALVRDEYLGGDGIIERVSSAAECLSQILLPPKVYTYLLRSLERVGENGLRLRLCLDSALVDAPWEFMRRPDASEEELLDGFLILNPRLSMVREAPLESSKLEPSDEQQRMVIVGAYRSNGDDPWLVKNEREKLLEALGPVKNFLLVDEEFENAAAGAIEDALSKPAAVFHYSGHVDIDQGRGFLLRENLSSINPDIFTLEDAVPMFSEGKLDRLLQKAGVRIAVFSACNSGRWPFVEPLLKKGLPALVGVQGSTTNQAATAFCHRLFSSLAIGLSLDEAVIYARLSLQEDSFAERAESCHWGSFMVYMPTTEAVLFPKPEAQPQVRRQQEEVRRTVSEITDKRCLRIAILRDFTEEEIGLVCEDLEEDLKKQGRYLEIDLEIVGGKTKETKIQNLITYLEKQACIPLFLAAVKRERPSFSC